MKTSKCILKLSCILFIAILFSCTDDDTSDALPVVDSSPNIVFIIADDMGWDVFGNYPGITGTKANTPTLDSLALNGLTFLNFWSNPVCSPTRAAMLTGKYAFRTGVGSAQVRQGSALQNNETIIQQYISDKTADQYASAIIGKWHVSQTTSLNAPENFGVDYYSGIFLGAVQDYYNWTQTSNGVEENITTYTTSHLVDQSIDWMQQQSKPFFLWLAFNAPHTPFHRPPLQLISDQSLSNDQAVIDANPFLYYLAAIEAMDTEIARLISSLTQEQQENTVFIFIGDNGTPRQVSQPPFTANRVKSTLFQGGVNTPLIISGKNIRRVNEVETALVHAPDIFATIADIAGAGSNDYEDGISLKQLLNDANASKRSFIYSEQFGNSPPENDGYAIRNENYKLIDLENGSEHLYNLSTDPFEQDDLLTVPLSDEAQQYLDQLKLIKGSL